MEFENITQRIGFFISKEILKTPADVTDAIKSLSDYALLHNKKQIGQWKYCVYSNFIYSYTSKYKDFQ